MFTIENRKCTQSPLKAWYKQITAAFISIYEYTRENETTFL